MYILKSTVKKLFSNKRWSIVVSLLLICSIILAVIIASKMTKTYVLSEINEIENANQAESQRENSSENSSENQLTEVNNSHEEQENVILDWNLILVNPWNKIPDGYNVEVTELINGQAVDSRAYPDLQQMMDDCRAAGLSPLICSSYRTQEVQQSLFDNQVAGLISEGYSAEEAEKKAGTVVAVPGTSEHQTGLALDIVDANNQNLDETQEQTAVQQWLMENSWKYGFVLRYPNGKSSLTGIIYEPWHYRYVGREAAKEIKEQNICLEEYLEQLK